MHKQPIEFKGHARRQLNRRFPGMTMDEAIHHFKTARLAREPRKDGDSGIAECPIGERRIRFVFVLRQGTIFIITVED